MERRRGKANFVTIPCTTLLRTVYHSLHACSTGNAPASLIPRLSMLPNYQEYAYLVPGRLTMRGSGTIIGKKAPDFTLPNQNGQSTNLKTLLNGAPLLLVFYPGDFTHVCTQQLCNYRDNLSEFQKYGINIAGISPNSVESHARFVKEYGFGFSLLSDPSGDTAKTYNCTSIFLLGGVSRGVCILNKDGFLLYRYVEPTTLSRRKAEELIAVIDDLRKNKLI